MRLARLVLLAALTLPAQGFAQALTISGHVTHSRGFTLAELAALPQETANPSPSGMAGDKPGTITGVLLWPLLDAAGWIDAPGRKTHMQHVILAHGRDGYAVALSIAEIDPNFEGKAVLIQTGRDGKPADRLDLFVPGDKRAARRVHDLIGIEVQ